MGRLEREEPPKARVLLFAARLRFQPGTVKITPFNHPLSPVDLDALRQELDGRPEEDRDILVVCLGLEQAARRWVDDWNALRKGKSGVNRIEIVELRSDPKYGGFLAHQTLPDKRHFPTSIISRQESLPDKDCLPAWNT